MPLSFMGPLSRLRLFGFLCPCHESDDEYNARMGAAALESLRIQWYRSSLEGTTTRVVDATLHLSETKMEGPFLNVHSQEYNVDDFTNQDLRIPLLEIDRIELVETEYRCEIQVLTKDYVLLQFHVLSPQEIVIHLQAVLHWDQDRRAELEKLERLQAGERLHEEEQKRLFDDAGIQIA